MSEMMDALESMLGEPKWLRRAKKLGYQVKVLQAETPYDDDTNEVEFQFTSLDGVKSHPRYPWAKIGIEACTVKLSIMPQGCGMVVLSGLWGFMKPETYKLYAYMIDMIMAFGKMCASEKENVDYDTWGNMMLATTSEQQRPANRYFRSRKWENLTTTQNPRGSKMWLWAKKLNPE